MSSEFLNRLGAVDAGDAGDATNAGVAAHYGNPLAEQRELAAGTAIVDLSHRAVITITGPDRLSWINALTSQSVSHLAPGESTEALLLHITGRIEYVVRLIDDGTDLWLLLEREEASGLLQWLASMQFALRVTLADRSDEFATIGTLGQAADPVAALPVAASHGLPLVWHDPWMGVSEGGYQYAAVTRHPAASWTYSELLLPRSQLAQVAASAIHVAGFEALEALRIAAWRPRLATEVDNKTIPHELDWLRTAVHLSKGGYRGQETVAKVHNIGHPPRRLVMLYLDDSDGVLPKRGDDVVVPNSGGQGRSGGQVTSVARHFELGAVALAVIKRGIDPTTDLLVRSAGRDIPARQVVVVPPDAGASAGVPRLPHVGSVRR